MPCGRGGDHVELTANHAPEPRRLAFNMVSMFLPMVKFAEPPCLNSATLDDNAALQQSQILLRTLTKSESLKGCPRAQESPRCKNRSRMRCVAEHVNSWRQLAKSPNPHLLLAWRVAPCRTEGARIEKG